jgi:hypothetical protein
MLTRVCQSFKINFAGSMAILELPIGVLGYLKLNIRGQDLYAFLLACPNC